MSLFCHQCGTENADNSASCRACGAPLNNPYQATGVVGGGTALPTGAVPNYLVQSILTTLCCCLPFGIVAIVYAAQVNGLLRAGDMVAAKKASDSAKMWSWIAFGIGITIQVLYFAFYALMIASGVAQP